MFFKSIFSRLFFTVITIIVMVVAMVSLTMSLFMYNYTVSKQVQSISEMSETVELMTGAMQIQESDTRTRQAFEHQLKTWSKLVHADTVIANMDGDIMAESNSNIKNVPSDILNAALSGD